jgi:DNA-binding MarR family transcriptional regulator
VKAPAARPPRAQLGQPFDPLAAGANEPLALLHFAFRAVVAEPDAELATLGLGRVHHRVLFFIARTPELRVVDLLVTLNITKQALHQPLQRLMRQKLVQSRTEATNRRERRLSLTSAGKALERRLSVQQRRAFTAAFRKAGPNAAHGWRLVMRELMNGA